MHLIVGLGNPGSKYSATRHNAGFMLVERLASAHGIKLKGGWGRKAAWGKGTIAHVEVALAEPTTYMNLSGVAVRQLLEHFKAGPKDLLVISDDCYLPVGKLRLKRGGGSGGQKGVESIIESIGTSEFARLRLGIGEAKGESLPDYVLSPFGSNELQLVDDMLARGAEAVIKYVEGGIDAAMNAYNR